jgi:hypothetical protein
MKGTPLADAFVRIHADTSSLKSTLRNLGSAGGGGVGSTGRSAGASFGKGFSGAVMGAVSKLAVGIGAALGAIKVGGFLKDAITQASDLNETVSKIRQVFGPAAKAVENFAARGAKSLGQSRTSALNAAASFGVFGKAAGLEGRGLSDFSTKLVQLSTDMASFSNTSPEDAVQALGAALRGENDPIERYGVLLNEAALEQEGLRIGIEKTGASFTPQQKVLVAYSAIMRQTKDAQGDFARTSGGLANQQRILTAQWQELKVEIGNKFLPIAVKLVTWGNTQLIPFLSQAWGRVSQFGNGVRMLWQAFQTGRTEDEGTKFEQLGLFIRGAWQQVMRFSNWWKTELNPQLIKARDEILPALISFWNAVSSAFRGNHQDGVRLSSTMSALGKFISDGLIPALSILTRYWLFQLKILFVGIGWTLNKVVVPALRGLMIVAINVIDGILTAAAKGFGWIPGLGGKLKQAKKDFDQFKRDVNAALNGIDNKNVKVTATAVISGDTWRLRQPNGTLGPIMRKSGGPIPGTGVGDHVPVLAEPGEHMLTKSEVKAAGGHDAIYSWRKALKRQSGGAIVNASGDTGPLRRGVPRLNSSLEKIAVDWGARLRREFSTIWDAPAVGGGGWKKMWEIVRSAVPGAILTSGYRPGSITATGNLSMHAMGRAIDTAGPMSRIFEFLTNRYPESREIIWSPGGGRQRYRGRPHRYGEPTRGDHWDHVHWGYDQGGWLMPGYSKVFNGTGVPERVSPPGAGGAGATFNNYGVVTTSEVEQWFARVQRNVSRHTTGGSS